MLPDGRAELKRMYVRPATRGRGISKAVLKALEDHATTLNATSLVLETGDRQDAALGLYERSGYSRIRCFGAYADSPSSICLEKPL
jgi:GNAT superfamily N-acetyltransferase